MLRDLTLVLMSFVSIMDIDHHYLFHNFIHTFERDYNISTFNSKFEVFKDNVEFIYKHNQLENKNFTLGINQYSDFTNDEFKEYTNRKFEKTYLLGSKKCNKMDFISKDTPDSIDWRDKNAVTPVKDQGQCGSCWSFSTTGAIEGISAIKNGELTSYSEQELVDCSSKYPYSNHACNGGLMDNAFEYVIDNGLCEENNYPYTASKDTCSTPCGTKVKINNCYDVPANNELALKEAVSNQPVSIAIEADTKYFQSYKSGVLTGDACGTNLDHGVLIAGYGTEDGTDYWLVKNSWSTSWGDEGYIKIERSDSTNSKGVCGIAMQASYPTI